MLRIKDPTKSDREQSEIIDESGNQAGHLSANTGDKVWKITLNDVENPGEVAERLRALADALHSSDLDETGSSAAEASPDPSADTDGATEAEASPDPSVDTDGATEAEASPDPSVDTEETPEADAAADESADTEETPEAEASPDPSVDTDGATEAEASPDPSADTDGATEAEASPDPSVDTDGATEAEASPDPSVDTEVTADTDVADRISSSEGLSTWVADKQANDASPTPEKQIREIRVESWLQVPDILRALHNNEGPLRITYPEIKNSAIAAEQTAISKFLIENAGNNLAEMLAVLEDKIENCDMVTSGQVSNEVANEYLKSFSDAISAEGSPLLTVAEVVRLNNSFKPLKNGGPSTAQSNKAARDQILATITDTMANTGEYHTCIIEVPTDYVDIAKMFIKQKWTAIPEDERPPTEHTKVWVADDFVSSASITEYDFEEFLRDARDVPEPKPKRSKKKSSSTPPGSIILDSSEESRSSS